MNRVLYAGSFDPITKGHMDVINQASEIFDQVVVAIMVNRAKQGGLFTLEERFEMVSEIYQHVKNIKVLISQDLAVEVAIKEECRAMVRGLRDTRDFEAERNLAKINRKISEDKIRTIALFSESQYDFVSSSMVRELHQLDQDTSLYVDPVVQRRLGLKK